MVKEHNFWENPKQNPLAQVSTAQLINQTSGNFEYYTPYKIVQAARQTMGKIDLDPASSHLANKFVKATSIFTIEDDGLKQKWFGKVWMNHPFGRDTNPKWIKKIIEEYKCGNIVEACCITYASTSEAWFQPLLSYLQCFLVPRTNYILPDGSKKQGVTKGSVVTYLGNNSINFHESFASFGHIK